MNMKKLFVVALLFCATSFGAMFFTWEAEAGGNCTTCDTNDNCITVNAGFNACGSVQINRQKDCNVSGGVCGV